MAASVVAGSMGSAVDGGGQRHLLSDKYELGEELGRGAFGQVYKGMDTRSGEAVAIKQMCVAIPRGLWRPSFAPMTAVQNVGGSKALSTPGEARWAICHDFSFICRRQEPDGIIRAPPEATGVPYTSSLCHLSQRLCSTPYLVPGHCPYAVVAV